MSNKGAGRRCDTNIIVSTGPDVCLTPIGEAVVPVAYSSIAYLGSAVRTNATVRINGKQDFHIDSRTPGSLGTEAGTEAGLMATGNIGPACVEETTDTVFSSGWASTRHLDPAWINLASFDPVERKHGTYDAPPEREAPTPDQLRSARRGPR